MMQQEVSVVWLLVGGVAMALITVSIFELFKVSLHWVIYNWSFRKTFDQFFGDNASSHTSKGVIILQSDEIQTLLRKLIGEPIKITAEHRSFKARVWVNRWDVEGAKLLREAFQTRRLDAPEFQPVDHKFSPKIAPDAPFAISMGLGFTDFTKELTEDLPWLRIKCDSQHGDCVFLKQELIPPGLQMLCPHDKKNTDIDADGFTRLLPDNWDLQKWLDSPRESRDFAIILRRTLIRTDGQRQVRFVLAGFTEIGTAAAGKFLAEKWPDLWKKYVRKELKTDSRGDFLAIVEGPSDASAVWSEDPYFPAITAPTVKRLGKGYEWTFRPIVSSAPSGVDICPSAEPRIESANTTSGANGH
jgi:hypothetical protein